MSLRFSSQSYVSVVYKNFVLIVCGYQGVKFLLFPPFPPFSSFSAIPPFFLLFRQNVLIVLLFTSVLGLCPLKCTFLGNFGCGCFQMAGYMVQSLLQEGGAGHTCMPCLGWLLVPGLQEGS